VANTETKRVEREARGTQSLTVVTQEIGGATQRSSESLCVYPFKRRSQKMMNKRVGKKQKRRQQQQRQQTSSEKIYQTHQLQPKTPTAIKHRHYLLVLTIFLSLISLSLSACPNQCSGHGVCKTGNTCSCFPGWRGGAPDCSFRYVSIRFQILLLPL